MMIPVRIITFVAFKTADFFDQKKQALNQKMIHGLAPAVQLFG